MNPVVSRIHSATFYGGQVTDAPNVRQRAPEQWHLCSELGYFKWYDNKAASCQNEGNRGQWVNEGQADMAMEIILWLQGSVGVDKLKNRVAIITPYKAQVWLLQQKIREVAPRMAAFVR